MEKKDFAVMFTATRNAFESAVKLGVEPEQARVIGEKMLNDKKVRNDIKKLDDNSIQTMSFVKTGLSRLAFGSVNEAVALVFDDNVSLQKILSADLFNVSEIKKIKGGGVEMKFFDRQKALEKLVELDPELKDISDAQQFINAVYSNSDNDKDILESAVDDDNE